MLHLILSMIVENIHLCLISRIHVTQIFYGTESEIQQFLCCINLFHFTFNTYMQCIQENKDNYSVAIFQ